MIMNKIDLNNFEVIELTSIEKKNIDGGSVGVLIFFFLLGVALGFGAAQEDGV